jgi:hypothetical protein
MPQPTRDSPLVRLEGMNKALLISLLPVGLCSGCHPTQEEKAIKIRHEFRALNLPLELDNDRTRLHNDQLKLDIAKLEGKRQDPTRFQIDKVALDTTEAAIQVARKIDQILSEADDPKASDLRARVSDLDRRLDDIIDACHSGVLAAKTVKEAQAACAALEAARREVIPN